MSIESTSRLAMRRAGDGPPRFSVGWHHAMFEHYRIVDALRLEALLPKGLELDRHDGHAYLSVVSFRMHAMRWRGLRLPWAHTYQQINVRLYVRAMDTVGVFFLRNYVSNRLAAVAGRWLYDLPYHYQKIDVVRDGATWSCRAALASRCEHRLFGTPGRALSGHEEDPSSLRFFLLERYPLFAAGPRGGIRVSAMLHAPWPLQHFDVLEQSHAILDDIGLRETCAPLDEVHFSSGVEVQMWRPRRLLCPT